MGVKRRVRCGLLHKYRARRLVTRQHFARSHCSGTAVNVTDSFVDKRFSKSQLPLGLAALSQLHVPVSAGNAVIGVLSLFNKKDYSGRSGLPFSGEVRRPICAAPASSRP